MNHSCINCKYKYEPTSIADYYNNTRELPGCDWSDPVLKHTYWLCKNNINSRTDYTNNSPVLKRCSNFNSYGSCPYYQTTNAINISPVNFSIKVPEEEIKVGDEITLHVSMASIHIDSQEKNPDKVKPIEIAPVQILTFSYQWYKDGRKLFKEKDSVLKIDTSKESTSYYHCIVTETIYDNGDGGKKSANITTNSVEINVTPETVEPIV